MLDQQRLAIAPAFLFVLFLIAAASHGRSAPRGGRQPATALNAANVSRRWRTENGSTCIAFKHYLHLPNRDSLSLSPSASWCTTIAAMVAVCASHNQSNLTPDRHHLLRLRCQRFRNSLERFETQLPPPTRRPLPDVFPGKAIMLLHMSKAGGTSLCNLGRYNNLTTHPKANNCWPPFNGPVWFASFRHVEVTCTAYAHMVESDSIGILANEAYLDGGASGYATQLCPNLTYVTMLRHPVARTLSHTRQAGIRDSDGSKDKYRSRPLVEQLQARPEIGNNYMTRFLLGKQAYESALDELDSTALEAALRNLLQMDVILVLEDPVQTSEGLGRLGWAVTDLRTKAGRVDPRRRHVSDLTGAEVQALQEANRLDAVLYQAALLIVGTGG